MPNFYPGDFTEDDFKDASKEKTKQLFYMLGKHDSEVVVRCIDMVRSCQSNGITMSTASWGDILSLMLDICWQDISEQWRDGNLHLRTFLRHTSIKASPEMLQAYVNGLESGITFFCALRVFSFVHRRDGEVDIFNVHLKEDNDILDDIMNS